jgi:hypothetical protein
MAGLRDTGTCGFYATGGWQLAWQPLFRRTGRVYVALDRDATDRAIALARTFGTRGRVLVPPDDSGPKGDLNDWLRVGAKGDPAAFRSILERSQQLYPEQDIGAEIKCDFGNRNLHRGISLRFRRFCMRYGENCR